VRIIAGSLRGLALKAPGGLDVRPTADRAREALFSILQKWPLGPFADLFAGTGAVGLEALSRGYGPVTCVERDPRALACLRANAGGRPLAVLARDVRKLGEDAFKDLAVVFADPPYDAAASLWAALAPGAVRWLAEDGVLVFESRAGTVLDPCPGLEKLDLRRYGAAEFHFFGRAI
jgi:16S rRNA (guanine966-N2)-methyltransferase